MEADLEGRELTNVRGERLGKIDTLFTFGEVDAPNWARVKIGRLGLHKAIVPLENSEEVDGKLCLPYETEHIQNAPTMEPEDGELSEEQVDLLCRHYGLERVAPPSGIAEDDIELPRETREAKPPAMEEGDDSPLVKRRRERMEELGVPEEREAEAESAEPADESEAPEPGSAEHEPESAMPDQGESS
jgi:hypothetical protein